MRHAMPSDFGALSPPFYLQMIQTLSEPYGTLHTPWQEIYLTISRSLISARLGGLLFCLV